MKGPPKAEVRRILKRFKKGEGGGMIPALQAIQEEFGWLPRKALEMVAEHFGVPLAKVLGVATFYAQFYLEPRGKHIIRCCRGTACHVRGASAIIQEIEKTLGIKDGETTKDMLFSFETVACLGACALAPVVVIDGKYYGQITPEKMNQLLFQYKGC